MAAKDEVNKLRTYTDQQGRTWYNWSDGNGQYHQSTTPPAGVRVATTPSGSGGTGARSSTVGGDNSAAFAAVKDTKQSTWGFLGYGISIGKNYATYRDALLEHLTTLLRAEGSSQSAESLLQQSERNPDPDNDGTNGMEKVRGNAFLYKSPSVSDASVGGNDAINPYSAFCLDDDIVHDIHYNGGYTWGMGRCYGEIYESKQVILYLTMGLPKFRNLQTWLENATNKELSEMNDIGTTSLMSKLGKLLGGTLTLAIQLPWLPFKWGANIINSIKDHKVTEYFYFRDNMPLYYRYVNSVLSEIAVGMGLYGNGDSAVNSEGTNSGNKGQPNNGANINTSQLSKYAQNMPVIMQEGPDIFKIMCRRAKRLGAAQTYQSNDDMFEAMEGKYTTANEKDKDPGAWNSIKSGLRNFWTGMETGALEGMNFIGFRIEKSENANESFSNSTADSPLLATLNNEVAQKREKALGALTGGEGVLSNAMRFAKNMSDMTSRLNNLMSKGSFTNKAEATIAYMASGNGYFDLPKQWSGSAGMSRSLSFNMKLRARTGGDNVSIYQSIMIPLACLIAAALPRGVGDSTYTSPFIIRAFCKGMFAVPAGIISTLSITRGSSEFGWSLSKLPTVVDVSFTIEDLSPMLFLSIAGQGEIAAVMQAFTNNTKMHEYINTLVGIGAKERYYLLGQLKRRLSTAMLIGKNTVFSATYRGYVMGDSAIVRSLMAVTPWTRVPKN